MSRFVFTEDEKRKIEMAMDLIIKDMRKIYNSVNGCIDEVNVWVSYRDEEYIRTMSHDLIINKDSIRLVRGENVIWLEGEPPTTKKKGFSFFKREEEVPKKSINYDCYYAFIKRYNVRVRNSLIEEVKKISSRKKDGDSYVDNALKEYDPKASIEVCFQTQNQQKIEVSYEDGRSVGLINFNGNVIKLVTDGDIVLVDKPRNPVKKK